MKIAVEGCAHGDLDNIYETIKCLEEEENVKVDLLLCCGDFQTSRNEEDLRCMAVPPKYYNICSFYKYYCGEKLAPILTILIGGNHEASNYLQELPYGGWVAPRIYYLGYAGVINIGGIRIGGISGIYKSKDYMKGHFETTPYDESTKRSVYHVRNLEVFRLKQISKPIDIFLSHDWPSNVTDFGNKEQLIRFKPHFREDIMAKNLGSKPCEELLSTLKPNYWFSAHLHCKFAALIPHEDGTKTRFLALDKCLPRRRFLQILDIPHNEDEGMKIKYDLEWLAILVVTNHLISVKPVANYMPGPYGNQRYCFTPSDDERNLVFNKFDKDLTVPENFEETAYAYNRSSPKKQYLSQPGPVRNPQTVEFCTTLSLDDPVEMILNEKGGSFSESSFVSNHNNSDSNIGIDDSVCETSVDEKTFIDDSLLENESVSEEDPKSSFTRTSLSLPKPQNESNDLFFIDTQPQDVRKAVKRTSSENIFDGDVPSVPTPECQQTVLGGQKKFKRRNIDLYKYIAD